LLNKATQINETSGNKPMDWAMGLFH